MDSPCGACRLYVFSTPSEIVEAANSATENSKAMERVVGQYLRHHFRIPELQDRKKTAISEKRSKERELKAQREGLASGSLQEEQAGGTQQAEEEIAVLEERVKQAQAELRAQGDEKSEFEKNSAISGNTILSTKQIIFPSLELDVDGHREYTCSGPGSLSQPEVEEATRLVRQRVRTPAFAQHHSRAH